jgi:hypothetical protein
MDLKCPTPKSFNETGVFFGDILDFRWMGIYGKTMINIRTSIFGEQKQWHG